jgi:hypothetical protein
MRLTSRLIGDAVVGEGHRFGFAAQRVTHRDSVSDARVLSTPGALGKPSRSGSRWPEVTVQVRIWLAPPTFLAGSLSSPRAA